MAKKKSAAKKAKSQFHLDPDRKASLLKLAGLVVAVFALFTLISSISYLFTWKADQSVLGDSAMMSAGTAVSNAGGKIGCRWGRLLIERCLGLGSFALVAFLFIAAYHLFFRTRPAGFLKTTVIILSGAVLAATILSYVSGLFWADTCFGGGLGGYMGAAIAGCFVNLIGKIGCGLLLALLVVCWLLFFSGRFTRWMATAFEKKEKSPEEVDLEALTDDEPVDEPVETEEPAELPEDEPEVEDEPAAEADDELIDLENPALEGGQPAADQTLKIIDGSDFSDEVKELPRIDVRDELKNYKFPSVDLLADYSDMIKTVSRQEIENNNNRIRTTLESYKILVDSVTAIVGPTVTLYKVKLAPGMKSAAVKNVEKDIAMALGNESVRVTILADAVGIEVANETKSMVPLKAMFNDPSFRESKAELPVALGYTITQKVKTFDLADAPHLLVAGATRQGKSVGLNVIVASLLYSKHPSELKLVFIDPKMVEFTAYKKLAHHYLAALPEAASEADEMDNIIVKDHKRADETLRSLCIEMDERYQLMSKAVSNKLKDYNEKYKSRHLNPKDGHRYLPYIVVVIDEYADLIMSAGSDAKNISKSVTNSIIRLAQKGRAAGIHVIIATQRPSVDVITGLIKTNFPTRIAFRVVTRIDSGTILDSPGAEKLIGKGDMLYYEGVKMERVQCAYIDMKEIEAITKFIGDQDGYKQHYNTPYYLPELPAESGEGEGGGMVDMQKLDANFEDAARMVVTYQKGSTSDLQRRLGMGYARAGKVMDQLEAAGIVGPQEGSKPRQVLVGSLDELQPILDSFL